MTRTEQILRKHLSFGGQMIFTGDRKPIGLAIKAAAAEIDGTAADLNKHQALVKKDIVMLVRLGIQAAGYVDLTDQEIEQVLQDVSNEY